VLFYRGIAVPADNVVNVISDIKENGIAGQVGRWHMDHHKPDPGLIRKPDLKIEDTRPKGTGVPAVCACGSIAGAAYYAWDHNKTKQNDTPIVITLEHDFDDVAVDGKDFLYSVLQFGDPTRGRESIRSIFGDRGLWFAEQAWNAEDQGTRIAIGDLMIHHREVVEAHYENSLLIAGRHNTRFHSAFTISLPIRPSQIVDVVVPPQRVRMPRPDVDLFELMVDR